MIAAPPERSGPILARATACLLLAACASYQEHEAHEHLPSAATRILVATLHLDRGEPRAIVRPQALDPAHPLAGARGAGNVAVLRTTEGRVRLEGRGARRTPTTEAVIGDLHELQRELAAPRAPRVTPAVEVAACPA